MRETINKMPTECDVKKTLINTKIQHRVQYQLALISIFKCQFCIWRFTGIAGRQQFSTGFAGDSPSPGYPDYPMFTKQLTWDSFKGAWRYKGLSRLKRSILPRSSARDKPGAATFYKDPQFPETYRTRPVTKLSSAQNWRASPMNTL